KEKLDKSAEKITEFLATHQEKTGSKGKPRLFTSNDFHLTLFSVCLYTFDNVLQNIAKWFNKKEM
ncbi:hypothetical protein, partial [Thalassotalea piscium]|uniref:hypothetical protein n=1 Tax=Thalassotalea piscium TaxID=1230533 RepID=UPI0031E66D35